MLSHIRKTSSLPMRILVAEDDLTIRTWLKVKLTKWGYDTDLAADGIKAIELYEQHHHTLVLTDWMMPVLDGIGLIKRIRETATVSKTYIILVTARCKGEDLITGIETGADDYIVKPVQSEELHARIMAAERILTLEKELQQKNEILEYANIQMKNDLDVAARIQQSFLPHDLPQFQEVKFEWGLLPCDELAGDALNVIRLDKDHVGFYLLDVSGHGVAAALLAMTLIHALPTDKSSPVLFEKKANSRYRL
ncbi:MAG: response regulator, partial [Candidatus Marinimicrobia bacterium]|nr:response regulator [Candidatus Neomarinimicrobiota bacterium]